MKLMTKAIEKALPSLDETADMTAEEQTVVVKFFGGSGATWWITAMDPENRTMFGLCDLGMGFPELGYVSLDELEALRFPPFGLPVERDLHFAPVSLRSVMEQVGA